MCNVIKPCVGKRSIQNASRSIDYNVTEYETFIDMVSGPNLQKLQLVEFWYSIKEEYLQLSRKPTLPFSNYIPV